MYSITDLKTDLAGIVSATNLNAIPNLTYLINRTARKVVGDIDLAECKRIVPMTSPVYGQVYNYALPSDLNSNRIIDIRPASESISASNQFNNFSSLFTRDFMSIKQSGTMNVEWNQGTKSLRLSASIGNATVINGINSITSNGTWALGGTGTNLSVDNVNFLSGGASLKFDTTVGTSAYLENSTMTAVDLSNMLNTGAQFLYVYLPTTAITNVILRWGSSATDYYEQTATAQQDGTIFVQGWNLLQFNWNGATVVGSPVDTAINYSRITLNYPSNTLTGVRVNNLVSQLGEIFDLEYYSNAIFRDSITGAFKVKTTSDNDLLNLDVDSYNIFLNMLGDYANQSIGGETAQYGSSYYKNEYALDKRRYLQKWPSEAIFPRTAYWTPPSRRRNQRTILTSQ